MKAFYERIKKEMELEKKKKEEEKEMSNIKWALKELCYARNNFNMVVGEDNVELAIYQLNVAEKRYQNLIKEAKKNGMLLKHRGIQEKEKFNLMIDECIS